MGGSIPLGLQEKKEGSENSGPFRRSAGRIRIRCDYCGVCCLRVQKTASISPETGSQEFGDGRSARAGILERARLLLGGLREPFGAWAVSWRLRVGLWIDFRRPLDGFGKEHGVIFDANSKKTPWKM